MTDYLYSIILGGVQGVTEFLPVSSTGHLVIFRDFLGLNVNYGLAFDAVLQLATALAVIVYFRKDFFGLFRSQESKIKNKGITLKNIIIASIPAIILGLFLQGYMETVFRSTEVVAVTLVIGAIIMFASEKFIKEGSINVKNSFVVGLFQSLALIPGMSRAGMTISGGYFIGLKKDLAIRFSFLLSIPIIAGSGGYKLLEIIKDTTLFTTIWPQILVGSISAFIFGIISIDFLIKFLKNNSFKGFVIYRILLAVLLLILAL